MIKHQKHKFKSYKSKIKPAVTSSPSTLCSSKKSWLKQHMKEQEMAGLLNGSSQSEEDDEECMDPSHEKCNRKSVMDVNGESPYTYFY